MNFFRINKFRFKIVEQQKRQTRLKLIAKFKS